jgi:SNF2 family DNA or RNA helicase
VAGLLLAPGMGKTSTILGTFKLLKKKKMVRRMLVIAPLRPCYLVWPAEVAKWTDFEDLKVSIIHGDNKRAALDDDADMHVINPEGLEWLYETLRNDPKYRNAWPWDMLVVDESTKFKHTNTKRFKLLKPMLNNFNRRYILTGTFAPNGMMDVFGQAYILDQGASLGRYITHFRNSFFYPSGYGGYDWQLRDGADLQIMDRLKPIVLRMSAEDWLDMPDKTVNLIYVSMPPEALRKYRTLEKEFFAKLDKGVVNAVNAGALSMKLRQFASGAVYTDREGAYEAVHTAKIDALMDLIEEQGGEPLLVAYEFRHDLEAIQAAHKAVYKKPAAIIGAGASRAEEARAVADWNAGKLPVMLMNPASGSYGLNLQQVGRAVCWYSLTWNLEHYEQFNDRIYRQGVSGSVVIHHILTKSTMDSIMYQRLQGKDKIQQAIMDAVKRYRKINSK